jgi:hypothetical protein
MNVNRTRKNVAGLRILEGTQADDVCDAKHRQPNHAVRGGVVGDAGRTTGEHP